MNKPIFALSSLAAVFWIIGYGAAVASCDAEDRAINAVKMNYNMKCAGAMQRVYHVEGHGGQTYYGNFNCAHVCDPNARQLCWIGGCAPCQELPIDPRCNKLAPACEKLQAQIHKRVVDWENRCNDVNRTKATRSGDQLPRNDKKKPTDRRPQNTCSSQFAKNFLNEKQQCENRKAISDEVCKESVGEQRRGCYALQETNYANCLERLRSIYPSDIRRCPSP